MSGRQPFGHFMDRYGSPATVKGIFYIVVIGKDNFHDLICHVQRPLAPR
jgi:hypothetical protein